MLILLCGSLFIKYIFTTLFGHLLKRWFMLRYSEFNVLNFKAWNPDPSNNVFLCVQWVGCGWGEVWQNHQIFTTANQISQCCKISLCNKLNYNYHRSSYCTKVASYKSSFMKISNWSQTFGFFSFSTVWFTFLLF